MAKWIQISVLWKLIPWFAKEQFSWPLTHLLISVYVICKWDRRLIWFTYLRKMLGIVFEMTIAKISWNKQMSWGSPKLLLCKLQSQYSAKGTISAPTLWYFSCDYHNLCLFMYLIDNMIWWSCVHSVFWKQNMIPKISWSQRTNFLFYIRYTKYSDNFLWK